MAIQKFAEEVLADEPNGFWRLGDVRGSRIAVDTSPKGNTGSVEGLVQFGQPGFHGGDTAALFDGATARIVVPNSHTLNPTRITMEAKIKWHGPTPANDRQRILEKESYGGTTNYGLSITPDGYVHVELRRKVSGPPDMMEAEGSGNKARVALGAETHVAATYDGLSIRIYINGELAVEQRVNSSEVDIDPSRDAIELYTQEDIYATSLAIGARMGYFRPNETPLGRRYFNGIIDEVALYPTALSAERIRAHYLAQFPEVFQYATKFVCSKSDGEVVAPGNYFTAVNIHNPTRTTVHFRAKVAVALPGLRPGPVSGFHPVILGPDEALEIDCPDIFNPEIFKFERPSEFLKGFVVIESRVELDVVAVYTAAGIDGQVETLHTERVPARRVRAGGLEVCVDFEPPLTVGKQYGAPAGHNPGDVVFTSNGIPVSVYDFNFSGGGGTFNVATIALAPVPFGTGQSINTNNISLEFDFNSLGFLPKEVSFEFLDLGGIQNLSVNGSSIFVGDLSSVPTPIGGANIFVSTVPVAGGKTGTATLSGVIQKLRVGGQEFWIDNVCVRE